MYLGSRQHNNATGDTDMTTLPNELYRYTQPDPEGFTAIITAAGSKYRVTYRESLSGLEIYTLIVTSYTAAKQHITKNVEAA